MSHEYLSRSTDDCTDEDASEVFVKRNGILQKISGKEKKKILANLKKKKVKEEKKKGKLIEDYFRFAKGLTSDKEVERTGTGSDFKVGDDYYEVIDHTKLSPEQERNKPKPTWQKPSRD